MKDVQGERWDSDHMVSIEIRYIDSACEIIILISECLLHSIVCHYSGDVCGTRLDRMSGCDIYSSLFLPCLHYVCLSVLCIGLFLYSSMVPHSHKTLLYSVQPQISLMASNPSCHLPYIPIHIESDITHILALTPHWYQSSHSAHPLPTRMFSPLCKRPHSFPASPHQHCRIIGTTLKALLLTQSYVLSRFVKAKFSFPFLS